MKIHMTNLFTDYVVATRQQPAGRRYF
jgi:hypothetical protein